MSEQRGNKPRMGADDIDSVLPRPESSKPAIRRFVKAAKEADYTPEERRSLYDRYQAIRQRQSERKKIFLGAVPTLEDERGKVSAVLQNIVGDRSLTNYWNPSNIKKLGNDLYEYGYRPGAEKKSVRRLSDQELKDISLLIKFIEDFFYSGRFLSVIDNDADSFKANNGRSSYMSMSGEIGFLVNTIAKVMNDREYASKLVQMDRVQLKGFLEGTDKFARYFLTPDQYGAKIACSVQGEGVNTMIADLRKKFFVSEQAVITDVLSNESDLGIMYLIKESMVAGSYMRKWQAGPMPLIDSYEKKQMTSYDFQWNEFISEEDWEKAELTARLSHAPSTVGVKKNKSLMVHYKPEHLIFCGMIVEYLRSKNQTSG